MWGDTFLYADAPRVVHWDVRPSEGLDGALSLLHGLGEFGDSLPQLVLGSDPLGRQDIVRLTAEAALVGMRVVARLRGTPALTTDAVRYLWRAGASALRLCIDDPSPARNDRINGKGAFDRILAAAAAAAEVGLPVQAETTVAGATLTALPALLELVRGRLGAREWLLVFDAGDGRNPGAPNGREHRMLTSTEAEHLCAWMYEVATDTGMMIRAANAPFFNRVVLLRMRGDGLSDEAIAASPLAGDFGLREGNGLLYISGDGGVFPSPSLLVDGPGGTRVVETYRRGRVFTALRGEQLKGRCGRCPFTQVCGGSRARAYAATGDYLETDPLCAFPA